MDAKLIVVGGSAPAAEYKLTLPTVIGRSRNIGLTLGQPLVSRQHCELYEADGVLMVRDLGSLNGTFVGDARIVEDTTLEPGALLTIGAVTFRAEYGDGAAEEPVADDATTVQAPEKLAFVPTAKPAAEAPKPAEIENTLHVGGLAELEKMRPAAAAEPAVEDEGGFDFGWLDEGSGAPDAGDAGSESPDSEFAEDFTGAVDEDVEEHALEPHEPGPDGSMVIETLGDHHAEAADNAHEPAEEAHLAELAESAEHELPPPLPVAPPAIPEAETVPLQPPAVEYTVGNDEDELPFPMGNIEQEQAPAENDDDLNDFFRTLQG
jgi:predicted component of type VI protein secretion system